MIWVILTALAAVCGAAKLDTKFLPPLSARTAGGSAGALLAPLDGSQGLPTGSYTNDAQGVVVDAVNPGTRTSGLEATGLGGPRTAYGSKDSKVGDAAFGVFSLGSGLSRIAPGFGSFVESDERQAEKTSGNSLKFGSDVGLDNFSGFETDNGISVGVNGDAAVGVKAQGSYDAQKYKDEGYYSSIGAGINNGKLALSGGDATSSGSVNQSGQRPTSGILVGSFTPGLVGSLSSQGDSAQGTGEVSGNKQSSFNINKDQSISQDSTVLGGSSSIGGQIGQADFEDSDIVINDQLSSLAGSSRSTESRFGVQTSKSEGSQAHAHAIAGSPVRSPSFQNGASAYSSAVPTGFGSASAFASSAPFGSGLKNEYLPPLSSFGSVGQHAHGSISGSDSSTGESLTGPSIATSSASVSGSQTQEQGPDNSYHYKKPSQPFTIPTVVSSGQYSVHRQPNVPASSISQQVSKYPNTPATVATGQYHGTSSSSYNGITQASISKFPSGSSPSKFPSSQFGSKPSAQLGQTSQQASSQFGSTETHSGHKVQGQTQFVQTGLQVPTQSGSTETHFGHQTSQTSGSSQLPSQQNQGTIYQYNKPATTQSTYQQTHTGSNVQTSFGQKPIVSSQVSGSKYQFGSFGSQFNQKPVKTQGSIVSSNTNSQSQTSFVQKPIVSSQTTTQSGSQFVQTGLQAPTQSGSTETHFGHQNSQTSDNSQSPSQQIQGTIYQYNKPATTQSTYQQTHTGSNVQTSFGQKPIVSSQVSGSKYQFGSFGSQFNQKPVKTQGSIVSSNTNTQSQTSFVQKPIVSSQTTTQSGAQFVQTGLQVPTQSGSTGTHFGHQTTQTSDNSQPPSQQNQGTIYQYNKPATTLPAQGIKDTSSFVQVPVTSGKPGQVETDSRFGTQQSLTTFGSPSTVQQTQTGSNIQTSVGQKPVVSSQVSGSKYQFGSFGSQFNQKPVKTQGSIVSSNTNTQSQTSFVQKPIVSSQTTTQSGSQFVQTGQQAPTQSGSTETHFGHQTSQNTGGSQLPSKQNQGTIYQYNKPATTQSTFQQTQTGSNFQTSFGQKPIVSSQVSGSKYQFGSFGSQFNQKPVKTQGSIVSSNTNTQSQTSFVQKPIVSSQTTTQSGSQFVQTGLQVPTQSGSTGTHFGHQTTQTSDNSQPPSQQNQGTIYQYNQPATTLPAQGIKDTSSFVQVPVTSGKPGQVETDSRFGTQQSSTTFGSPSTVQQTQTGSNVQTLVGQKPIVSSQVSGSKYQFGSFGSQFNQKPVKTQGSIVSSNTNTQSQTSFVQKPIVSSQTTTQSGSQFVQTGQQAPTQSGSTETHFGHQTSQNTGGSQLPSKQNQGTIYQYNKPATTQSTSQQTQTGSNVQTSVGQKPVVSSQVSGSKYQFGSFGSQFNQKPVKTQGSIVSSNTNTQSQTSFVQKPIVSSQTTTQSGSQFVQTGQQAPTQSGSTETHFGHQTSQNTGGSQLPSKQNQGTIYQYNKPATTQSTFQQTQTGSNVQTSVGQKPVVSSQVSGSKYQFGSFGSQFNQKPVKIQGSTVSSNTNTLSSQAPSLVGTSYLPSKIESSGSQFGQNVQSSFGAGSVSTTAKPVSGSSYPQTQIGFKPTTTKDSSFTYTQSQISQFEKKPVVSTTQTQFGSTSKFGQDSQSSLIGTSNLPSKIGSSVSQFGQNTQSSFGAGSVSTTAKPVSGSSYPQTQIGFKPTTTKDSSFTYTQSQISQFEKKPVVSTTQTQFGSTSKFGQNSQSSLIGTSYLPSKIESSGSPFGQNVQSSLGAKGPGLTTTTSQTSFGIKPVYQQTQFGSTGSQHYQASQFAKQPVSTTTTSVTSQQTKFELSGSKVSQHAQSTDGVGSVSITTPSRIGESSQTIVHVSTISQNVEPSQFGQKPIQTPFGSSTTHFGQKPQANAFASSSGSNVVPFSSTQTGQVSKYETSQFGVQNQGIVSSTQKPVGSSLSQTNHQQYQYTQTVDKSGTQSQFGKSPESTVGSGQIGQTLFGVQAQKPFVSTQTNYKQTQYFTQGQKPFGSSQGSSVQIVGQSIGEKPTQGIVQTSSVPGYKYPNPQSGFTTKFGSQSSGAQDQKVPQSHTNFNSAVSTSQTPIKGETLKPFGVPSTQSTFQQTQSTVSSSQSGVQAVKPSYFNTQTSYNKFSGKPFQPASTVSKQGSNVHTQSSVVSTPQFGVQNQGVVSSTQKPVGNSLSQSNYQQQYQYTQTVDKSGSQSQFGKGSQSNVGNGQITFGAQSQKPFGSSQTTNQQAQYFTQGQKPFGSSQGSTIQIVGQSIGEKPTQGIVQTSSVPGYKYPNPQSGFTTKFGSQSSGALDQKVQQSQTNFNSAVSTSQTPIDGQPLKPFGVQSTQSTFQQTQSTVSSPQFGVQAVKPSYFNTQTSYNKFSEKPFQPASSVSTQGANVQTQYSAVSTPQFEVQNQGVVSSTQKPVGSSLSQTNHQQYQYTQTVDKSGTQSQFGKGPESNVGSGQIGQTLFGVQAQKPFVSTQTNYKQTQYFTQGQKPFGSSQGSSVQIVGQSIGEKPTQGNVQTSSVPGYKYPNPQSGFTTKFGSQSTGAQDQKVLQSQTNFNSAISTSQTPINGQPLKPFGVPSTQSTFQQSQFTVSSSKFGVQAVKPTGFTAPVIQTSYNKNSGKPFQPASIVSTQGSHVQTQSSAVSSSQFGVPTPSTEIAHFDGRPEFSIHPSIGVTFHPSVSSSTQAPSGVGSNEGLAVSTVQTPIESIPGYELVVKEGNSANHKASHAFVGLGEQFGGPRDPPRFDEETGLYYY